MNKEKEDKIEEKNEDVLDMETLETTESSNFDNEILENEKQDFIEEETETVKKDKKVKTKNKVFIYLIILLAVLLLICLAFFLFIFSKTKNGKVLNNVYFNEMNLGNKTKEEIKQDLEEKYKKDFEKNRNINIEDKYIEEAKEIIKKQEERQLIEKDNEHKEFNEKLKKVNEYNINPKEIDFDIDIDKIAEDAYSIGRTGNFIEKAKVILKSMSNKKINIREQKVKYEDSKLETLLAEIDSMIPAKIVPSSYVVEGEELIVTNGEKGFVIDKENTTKTILDNFRNLEENKINLALAKQKPEKLNAEEMHEKIKKEVKDASFNQETRTIEKEVDGVDFAISIEEVNKILSEDKDIYKIPLKITKPKVTSAQFEQLAFKDTLATYTSNAVGCGPARATNLAVGSQRISGTIINPGEVFSFINAVGEISAATGYAAAGIYTAKGVEQGIGGGICQVVSTVYNSALISGMEILQRHQHSYIVDYVPAGRDATMYAPTLDLKFRNTLSRPIKIVAWANGGAVTVQIKGIDEGVKGEVSSQSAFVGRPTERIPDPNLPEDEEVRSATGFDGARSTTYYKLWKNGNLVKNQVIHSDYYKPMGKVVVRYGTKKAEAPKPEPTPAPKPQQPTEEKPSDTNPAQNTKGKEKRN